MYAAIRRTRHLNRCAIIGVQQSGPLDHMAAKIAECCNLSHRIGSSCDYDLMVRLPGRNPFVTSFTYACEPVMLSGVSSSTISIQRGENCCMGVRCLITGLLSWPMTGRPAKQS